MRIGIHTSRSGSLEKAALKAVELGANTFQIFSSSPRMWQASAPDAEDIRRLKEVRARFDLKPLVIHVNYLVNLAAADAAVREKSIAAFRGELERAEAIGAEYLVLHPGSYKGWASAEEGVAAFVRGLRDAAAGLKLETVMVLVENTVGAGAQLGGRFEELRAIREQAAREAALEVGFCLDTCHLLGAGFELRTAAGLDRTVRRAARVLGLSRVKVIHANDSKGTLGSRRDRHENIGKGHIGDAGFRLILAHPKLSAKPFILETPIGREGDDRRNIERLKKLCPKSRTTTKRSS